MGHQDSQLTILIKLIEYADVSRSQTLVEVIYLCRQEGTPDLTLLLTFDCLQSKKSNIVIFNLISRL